MNSSSEQMMHALGKGDKKAFHKLYDLYYETLCLLAYQYVKDAFLAESFVGDVIYNIWEHRETFQVHTSLKAYLVKAVRNRCINYLEHEKVRKQVEQKLTKEQQERQQDYSSDIDYPLGKLIVSELEESLSKAINSLPPECRQVFLLSREEELSYNEIAGKLDISVNTVKYHIKNALLQLREQFKDYLLWLLLLTGI